MELSMMGSIHTYTKTLDMQVKWNKKKESGNIFSHEKTQVDMMRDQMEQQKGDTRLKDIMTKVEAGSKLTEEEKQYLQVKDPEAYQELQAREREQKEYEQALRRCKTKEDVQRLKASKMGASMTKLRSVENNPHIETEKKLKIFMNEKLKLDKFEQSTQAFVKSGEFAKLPTDAERAKVEKELHEEEKVERNPELEQTEQKRNEAEAEQVNQIEQAEREKAVEKGTLPTTADKAPLVPQVTEKPVIKIETPEERKVRRAKARAAYAALSGPELSTGTTSPRLNIKG